MQPYLTINKRMGGIVDLGLWTPFKKNKNVHDKIFFKLLYVTIEFLLMKIATQFFIIYITLFYNSLYEN